MAETYCGKSCAQCAQKEALNCPGCKLGPGKLFSDDCDIAKCCRENGHMSCDTCSHSRNYCAKFNTRGGMAEFRKQKQDREARKLQIARERSSVLGKWLWILFWLRIANTALGLLGDDLLGGLIPLLSLVDAIGGVIISIASIVILFQLGDQHSGYRTSAICTILVTVMDLANLLFGSSVENTVIGLVFTVPSAIIALVGQYKLYSAHSDMLVEVDDELSEKWMKLWKWYIIVICVTLGSLLITFLIPMLGILMVLAGTVGALVVAIMELVYLYKTASAFRDQAHMLQFLD